MNAMATTDTGRIGRGFRAAGMIVVTFFAACGGADVEANPTTTAEATTTAAAETSTTEPDPEEAAIEWVGEEGARAVSEWLQADQDAKNGPFLDDVSNPEHFPEFADDVGSIALAANRVIITLNGREGEPPAKFRADIEVFLDAMRDVEEAGDVLSRCLNILDCDEQFSSLTSVSARAYDAVDAMDFIQEAIDRAGEG